MGRDKLGELRAVALEHGGLDLASAVPDDAMIVSALGQCRRVAGGEFDDLQRLALPRRRQALVRRWRAGPRHPLRAQVRTGLCRQLKEPNPGADLRRNGGDDSPLKACALFDLPMSALPFGERQLLWLARLSAGETHPSE